jgi:F420-dependent oxidoreductase-like protein
MRIGVTYVESGPLSEVLAAIERAEQAGFDTAWVTQFDHLDSLAVLALAGRLTRRIELGSAVAPTYHQHPAVLARQALTAQQASGGRLALGVGPSHRILVEGVYGLKFDRPIRHMREYLAVLRSLLSFRPVHFQGEMFRVDLAVPGQPVPVPPILVAALGPQMLRLAGTLADGVITFMGGPAYLRTTAVPIVRAAAQAAARPAPRIVAGFPIAVTSQGEAARRASSLRLAEHAQWPSYRGAMQIEGAREGADVSLIGGEADVRRALDDLRGIGVTDLLAQTFAVPEDPDGPARTWDFLAALARSGALA